MNLFRILGKRKQVGSLQMSTVYVRSSLVDWLEELEVPDKVTGSQAFS